jgi:Ala-tRNA(Pro) deacylase
MTDSWNHDNPPNGVGTPDSGPGVFERLKALLVAHGVDFTEMRHTAVYTSAEAAAVRGTTLHSGAKALIVKAGSAFRMIVMPADLSLDSKASRMVLGSRQIRFATEEEVLALTGLRPGSIPPFGSLFSLATICDDRMADNKSINFNAGSHTRSIHMAYSAYVRVENPRIARVAKEATV